MRKKGMIVFSLILAAAVLADGILAVTYMTGDGKRVTLRYGDDGNTGLWVHDTKKDTLYARTGDGASVTTNYYKGLRMRVE